MADNILAALPVCGFYTVSRLRPGRILKGGGYMVFSWSSPRSRKHLCKGITSCVFHPCPCKKHSFGQSFSRKLSGLLVAVHLFSFGGSASSTTTALKSQFIIPVRSLLNNNFTSQLPAIMINIQ